MVFNSLLAYASVNHLHYHFLYMNYPLIAEKVVIHSLYLRVSLLGNNSTLFAGWEAPSWQLL